MKRQDGNGKQPRRGWLFGLVVAAIVLYFAYAFISGHGLSAALNL